MSQVISTRGSIDSDLFVTVSGPPGCGATSLSERLSDAMDCPCISGGDIFRQLAEERGMSLTQLTAKAETSAEIDRALDGELRSVAERWGSSSEPCILESRLAGWLAGDRADLRIWLDAPDDIRMERLEGRTETEAEARVREVSEAGRYRSYYDIDLDDRGFYDLTINTGRWDPEGVFSIVATAIEAYDPMSDEGSFPTPDIDL